MNIGDTVYLNGIGNHARSGIQEGIIQKIGRKYIHVSCKCIVETIKFDIEPRDNGERIEVTNYCKNWEMYLSMQALNNHKEYDELLRKVKDIFYNYGFSNFVLSLEQLRKINNIIDQKGDSINEIIGG